MSILFPRRFLSSLIVLALLSISGCTQRYNDLANTLKEGFMGFPDVEMSTEDIMQLSYASAYMRFDNAQRIFMVLAFAEKNPITGATQLKWLSADGAMVTTEQGRVVKTLNLPGKNLIRRQSRMQGWQHNKTFALFYDWPETRYGFSAHATLRAGEDKIHTSKLWKKNLTLWREEITFDDAHDSMTNLYWVDNQGEVMKSTQYVGPNMMKIDIEILKPYMEAR